MGLGAKSFPTVVAEKAWMMGTFDFSRKSAIFIRKNSCEQETPVILTGKRANDNCDNWGKTRTASWGGKNQDQHYVDGQVGMTTRGYYLHTLRY